MCVCTVVIQVQVEIWRTAILSCAEGKPGAINLAHNRIARATGHSLRVFFCLFFAPRKCIVCIVLYLVRFFLPPRCVPEPKMCVCVCVHVKNWRIKGSLRMLYIRLIDRVCMCVCARTKRPIIIVRQRVASPSRVPRNGRTGGDNSVNPARVDGKNGQRR